MVRHVPVVVEQDCKQAQHHFSNIKEVSNLHTSHITHIYPISLSDRELEVLRGENRRNMMLSVALLAISALFYYTFIY